MTDLYRRLGDTGIGYAGIDGCWWLPACEPFGLPMTLKQELEAIAAAVFALLDAVLALYGRNPELTALLDYKVPMAVRRQLGAGRVAMLRPDFQLVSTAEGLRPVATELEICPSAQGFAHAMQVAYGLETDLLRETAALVADHELVFVGTEAWSEFLFEQLAFCKALAGIGGRGRVLYNRPLSQMAAEIAQGRRWRPPLFGVAEQPAHWDTDVPTRMARRGLEPFWWADDAIWPETMGDAVLFRFGYVTDFTPGELACFRRWQQTGARWLNPPHFVLDSKAILAAARLSAVRNAIGDPDMLAVLDSALCESYLLQPDNVPDFIATQDRWLLKFAGFDSDQQAWGGRSLQIGLGYAQNDWRDLLRRAAALPWPVIVQRVVPSLRLDIAYLAPDGTTHTLTDAATRLRCFFLRHDDGRIAVAGAHLTVCRTRLRVAEATDAVQAPVQWNVGG